MFLACFAALFLLPDASGARSGGLGPSELVAYVSPRLSSSSVNSLFLRLQERADVQSVRYSLPEQVTSERTGGSFVLIARSTGAVDDLAVALRAMDGIVSVETSAGGAGGIALTKGARLGFLCGLVVCALLSLLLAREGFRALLHTFRHEIRLMRLSGVSERRILVAVEVTGLLIGLLAGVLLAVGLALYGVSASEASGSSAARRDPPHRGRRRVALARPADGRASRPARSRAPDVESILADLLGRVLVAAARPVALLCMAGGRQSPPFEEAESPLHEIPQTDRDEDGLGELEREGVGDRLPGRDRRSDEAEDADRTRFTRSQVRPA